MDHESPIELPQSRWADVGGPVHYREWPGPGDGGPVFVCVHGLGGSLVNWALVAPGLARHGRVIALDLVGFGLTPPEGRGTDVRSNRRLLAGFMRALELPPVVLVGNSMGGMISVIHCAREPASVEAMILVDAALPRTSRIAGQFNPRVAALFAVYGTSRRLGKWITDRRTQRLGADRLVEETLKVSSADVRTIDPRMVRMLIENARDRQGLEYASAAFLEAARSIFLAQAAPGRYRELVRRAHGPALVMHGAKDRLVPLEAAREAVRWHDDWELEVFGNLGHIPMMEAPQRWLRVVEDWLARSPMDARRTGTA